ncbi:AMP-binding protein [Rhodobacter capsulatus]|uniref:AMP-binding protein n=1 Tax=Rhodobacter capsulatus TaxID=1061 RepID=UPI0040261A35
MSQRDTPPPPTRPTGNRVTLAQVLHQHAQNLPDKIAVRFLDRGEGEGRALTYAELDLQVRALAARLEELGARGQTVLLVYPAGLPFIIGFWACLYAGAIAVPTPFITPARSAPRIAAIAADARPCLVLSCAALAGDATIRGAFPADLAGLQMDRDRCHRARDADRPADAKGPGGHGPGVFCNIPPARPRTRAA